MRYEVVAYLFNQNILFNPVHSFLDIPNDGPTPTIATYIFLFVLSLLVGVVATPLVRRLALKTGVVNAPSARNIHFSPVPLLGGLAIYLAFIFGLITLFPFYISQVVAILLGASIISLFGLLDDKWGLHPLIRLGGQFGVAAILVATGVKFSFLPWDWANIAISLLWVVGITNAINFLDNMDGLSAGVSAIAASFFFLVAFASGQWLVAALGAALAGAAFGFVYHNFGVVHSHTTIFMGDTGALFLGHLLAAIGLKLHFSGAYASVTWLIPMLILGLPIFDTSLVVISRLRRHIHPLRGGKDHTSHRLVALGLTRREAVLVLYLVGAGLGACAMMVTMLKNTDDNSNGYIVAGLVLLVAVYAFIKFEQLPLIDTNPKVEGWGKGLKAPKRAGQPAIEATAGPEDTKIS